MTTADNGPDADLEADLDPDVAAFDEVCRRLAGFNDELDTEWIDGYLTALGATWRVVPTADWLPLMVGDAFERACADPDDAGQVTQVLEGRLSALRLALNPDALLDEPDAMRLAPLMQVWNDETRAELVSEGLASAEEAASLHTGARWAEGFFAAVSDFEADWPHPGERGKVTKVKTAGADADLVELFNGLMQTVAALAWDPTRTEYQEFARGGWKDGNPTRDEHIDEACFAVQDLRIYWLDHAPKGQPRRVDDEPGRNDPCPCGSGKKYKRCHGAN